MYIVAQATSEQQPAAQPALLPMAAHTTSVLYLGDGHLYAGGAVRCRARGVLPYAPLCSAVIPLVHWLVCLDGHTLQTGPRICGSAGNSGYVCGWKAGNGVHFWQEGPQLRAGNAGVASAGTSAVEHLWLVRRRDPALLGARLACGRILVWDLHRWCLGIFQATLHYQGLAICRLA